METIIKRDGKLAEFDEAKITDAIEKKGAFETARGGTVFLDEIAEMTPAVQAKLLRTLETGRGHRVGAVEDIQYDVRVLSATNAELYGGWPMVLSGLKTLLETGELLDTPGSLLYEQA